MKECAELKVSEAQPIQDRVDIKDLIMTVRKHKHFHTLSKLTRTMDFFRQLWEMHELAMAVEDILKQYVDLQRNTILPDVTLTKDVNSKLLAHGYKKLDGLCEFFTRAHNITAEQPDFDKG